jgi:transposase
MKKRPSRFVGIDVSKDYLDLACRPEDTRWRVAHDSAGIAQCLAQLRQLKPTLIVLEATGGWQGSLVAALAVSKRPVAVMNPRQIRDVAKATGELAKTDALDAGVMAHVAEAMRPTPRPLPDEMTPQIDALLQRRRQLLAMLVAERHRVALAHPAVRDSLARQMDALQGLINATDEEVAAMIRTSPAWREKDDVLQSAPGIGPVLSATLHAALPE